MNPKALVVEDEEKIAYVLAENLRLWGFDPTVMFKGGAVVSWVREHNPSLILLDLILPDDPPGQHFGYAICETLKLDRDTNLIPIIMITALDSPEDRVKGLQVGANYYLTKPFPSALLQKAIEETMARVEELKQHGTAGEIRFHLQSDTNYLEELNDLMSTLLRVSGLSEREIRQLITAVRELGQNAIEWGHRRQVDRIVTVDYCIDSQKITITIKDTGPGFNPANLPHAARPDDPLTHMMVRETLGLREGGFGIMLSKGLVDDLKYNEVGNEVRLVKNFPPRSPSPADPL